MSKILELGTVKSKSTPQVLTCPKCKTKFEVTPSDDIGGGLIRSKFHCPHQLCDNIVMAYSSDLGWYE